MIEITKNTKTTRIQESIRSKIPPCPLINVEKSLMPTFLLIKLNIKSPKTAEIIAMMMMIEITNHHPTVFGFKFLSYCH